MVIVYHIIVFMYKYSKIQQQELSTLIVIQHQILDLSAGKVHVLIVHIMMNFLSTLLTYHLISSHLIIHQHMENKLLYFLLQQQYTEQSYGDGVVLHPDYPTLEPISDNHTTSFGKWFGVPFQASYGGWFCRPMSSIELLKCCSEDDILLKSGTSSPKWSISLTLCFQAV